MGQTVFLSISALIYTLLITILFFCRPKLKTLQNDLFKKLILVNIVSLIIEIFVSFALFDLSIPILSLLLKISFIFEYIWICIFMIYTFSTSHMHDGIHYRKKYPKIYHLYLFFNSFIIFLILIFPIHLLEVQNGIYWYGKGANLILYVTFIYVSITFYYLALNRKKIKRKEYIPIISFVILLSIVMFIQKSRPDLIVMNAAFSFITVLIFHTLEDPDLKMIEQLNLAKEKADRALKVKEEFLANVSHEIRTPLHAIEGFSQAILEENDIDTIREDVKDIVMASSNLSDLVKSILDISKIESDDIKIQNAPYSIKDLALDVASLMKNRIGEKPIEFIVDIDSTLPETLLGDADRMKQIMVNLLINAIKYTKVGYVKFSIKAMYAKKVCKITICVEDSGIGIPKEDMDKLFTKFMRLDFEQNKTISGLGVGLAITKNIVELMNGKIYAESIYQKGSKFTVIVDQSYLFEVKSPKIEKKKIIPFNASNTKILVVDDNFMNIKVATLLLKKYKIKVDFAYDGMECIEKIINGNKYDFIFLDDMMPRMSGIETFERLKKIPSFSAAVIVLTNDLSAMREEYISYGFLDFLAKPIDKYDLDCLLKKHINKIEPLESKPNDVVEKILKVEKNETLNFSDKRVLVVDDNAINIKIMGKFLKKYHIQWDYAESGDKCLALLEQGEIYDLILMDDMMPNMSGIETLQKLRSLGHKVAVAVVTANAVDGMREKYLKAGFCEYLTKPVSIKVLDTLLKTYL